MFCKLILPAAFVLSLFVQAAPAGSGAGGCGDSGCCDSVCCDTGCCDSVCCDPCCETQKTCVYTPEKGTEEKHCWCVECEAICVPKVRCPWSPGGSRLTCFSWLKGFNKGAAQCGDACGNACGDACGGSGCCGTCDDDCCGDACCCAKPRCGKVLCVRDLKKKKYEVDVCEWKAEIRRLPPCCCDNCQGPAGCCECVTCGE